jgi:hypothetical protein
MMSLTLKTLNGAALSFKVRQMQTTAHLKGLVAAKEGINPELQRIVYAGKELEDSAPLFNNGVKDGSQLHVVLKVANVQVLVKTLKDRVFYVQADQATTVADLKNKVFAQDPSWEVLRQRIIFQGRELSDTSLLLSQCGLDGEAPSVYVVMRLPAPGTSRKKKEDTGSKSTGKSPGAGKGKGKGAGAAVLVKQEPMDDSSSVASDSSSRRKEFDDDAMASPAELDGMLGMGDMAVPMELEAAWEQFQDEEGAGMDGQWDHTVQLPALAPPAPAPANNSPVDALEIPSSPPAADPAEAANSSFADMVANASTEGETSPTTPADKSNLPWPSTQGRAYDLSKVDDKLRKRLLKNRLSAERSRQRKQAHVETLEFELSCCRSENEHLKKRVAALEQQLATALNLSSSQAAEAALAATSAPSATPALRPQVAV